MNWMIVLINFITIGFLFWLLVKATIKYKTLKLEWEEQNSAFDVLTSNYNKAKKEISDLQDQYDDLSIRCNNEIQRLTDKYERKLSAVVLRESEYLTSIEEAAMREANYLNTIADLEKTINEAAAKKERAKARAKKKKEVKTEEQLEEAVEQLGEAIENFAEDKGFKVTIDDVEIAPGEGEIKCEKKRRRKKGENN